MTESWRTSAPHAALLSKYKHPQTRHEYEDRDYWEAALREPVRQAVDRFVADGYLRPATLSERLDTALRATDLKKLMKAHGLKVSGRKAELIDRLIQNAPDAAESEAANQQHVLALTEAGREHVGRYLSWERERRETAVAEVRACLERGDVNAAIVRHRAYMQSDVFADPHAHYPVEVHLEFLSDLKDASPGILASLRAEAMPKARLAAALSHFFGRNVGHAMPTGFAEGTHFDDQTAAQMLMFHAWSRRHRRQLEDLGRVFLRISCVEDGNSCSACAEAGKGRYTLGDLPELPLASCTSVMGCRCTEVLEDDL